MELKGFNIRVYGILINEKQEVLITDEYRMNTFMTKFPGGGLHLGEGTIACLKRECHEELGVEIEVIEHFYTTDYFQPTRFLPGNYQLISIYYLIAVANPEHIKTSHKKFDFPKATEGAQSFRWLALKEINEGIFTLPVDKRVAVMLKEKHSGLAK